jgi:hypothetical protein
MGRSRPSASIDADRAVTNAERKTMKKRKLRTAAKRRRKAINHPTPKGLRWRKRAGKR